MKREIEKNFKRKETDSNYKKKVKQGEMKEVLKIYLDKIRQRFIKKYGTRKQKAYMRSSLQKPKSLSVDIMSSRFKYLSNYLSSCTSPDNKSFSQGEMIKIVLSMLPTVWVNSMTTVDL